MNYFKKCMLFSVIIGSILFSSMHVQAEGVLLKQGMQGETVKQVQVALKQLGYFESKTTGYFGSVTKDAVERFQRDRNFSVDGIIGNATWSSLIGDNVEEAKVEEIVVPEAEPLFGVLKSEMSGEQVRKVQNRLKELGFFNSNATGYYGNVTKTAVENFQSSNGITADGIVGNETWSKLFKVVNTERTERTTISRGSTSRGTSSENNIVNYAKNFLGVKYVWGGNTSKGFDCSGYAKYVYNNFDIELNRVAADQAKQGTWVSKDNLKAGDLVFFDTDGGKNYINHVGIYIGNGTFIHASSSKGKVIISDLSDGFYSKSYMSARTFQD